MIQKCPSNLCALASQDSILRTLVCQHLSLLYLAASKSYNKKYFHYLKTFFMSSVFLIRGLQKCAWNSILTMAFWGQSKTGQKITAGLAASAVLVCILQVAQTAIIKFQFLEYFSHCCEFRTITVSFGEKPAAIWQFFWIFAKKQLVKLQWVSLKWIPKECHYCQVSFKVK